MKKLNQSGKNKGIALLLRGKKLILASGSPRRAEILRREKVEFEVRVPSDVTEESFSTDPVEHVLSASKKKAESIFRKVGEGIILGADTIVVLDGEILGKPQNKREAFWTLRKLSGKIHKVYTGITLMNNYNGKMASDYDLTWVKFNRLDEEKIRKYIDTGEPMDKAGAYGIQGMGGFLVESIRGSLDNVIGLPTEKLRQILAQIL